MFGSGEEFSYFRCRDCDTLQIEIIPANLGAYYPQNYYSMQPPQPSLRDKIKRFLRPRQMPQWMADIDRGASILDVGCGGGATLSDMRSFGFRKLEGYDPFLERSFLLHGAIQIGNQLPSRCFDVVMMHHSLEHMPDPIASLTEAAEMIGPQGKIIVRIPVRQGAPWREYGLDWVHLDPPRHLYLWTVDGFRNMVGGTSLQIDRSGFDTTVYSFAGSDLIRRGIPTEAGLPTLSEGQLTAWRIRADELNRSDDGDNAWFVLSKR